MTVETSNIAQQPKQVTITHRPGRHCGSSAIRDLLEYHGHNFTEAFCFGLGAGLGINYVELPGEPVPFIVHVRSMGYEEKVFSTINVPFQWDTFENKTSANTALRVALAEQRPALLLSDIYHLPYFNTKTHFPGHAIMAWKKNNETHDILVTDTERPDLIPVPEMSLSNARFSNQSPFFHSGNMFAPAEISATITAAMIDAIIEENARTLNNKDQPNSGVAALGRWVEDLPRWINAENSAWLFRFAYQVIEKRGTGGGGFRFMYAEFLEEAEKISPSLKHKELPTMMRHCAHAWTALANVLKTSSENELFAHPAIEQTEDPSRKLALTEEIANAIGVVRNAEIQYINAALGH